VRRGEHLGKPLELRSRRAGSFCPYHSQCANRSDSRCDANRADTDAPDTNERNLDGERDDDEYEYNSADFGSNRFGRVDCHKNSLVRLA